MKFQNLIVACLIVFGTSIARASILVEPYLGYTLADYETSSNKYDANGIVMGARLAYELPVLWFGVDYMMSNQTVETNPESDADASRLGVAVGANVPMGVRVWGAYYFSDSFEFDGGSELEGTGVKLGVGFRLIPLLHLNFEYLMSTYDESDGASITDREVNGFIVSLSVPLSL
jgi:hypothetical protein